MSDFSQLKHKDRSKVFYVDEDEKGNEYLAYKLRNDPLEQVYFVLFLDDYNMFVDENDFGQDVLAYETDDEEVKYIDFDNIELTEDNQLIMKANTDEGEYDTITLDLNEEASAEADESATEEDVEEEEEEEEEYYMEEDDPETRSRKVYLNYKEPEVYNPNLPIKRFSFRPGAVNEMNPSPPLRTKG